MKTLLAVAALSGLFTVAAVANEHQGASGGNMNMDQKAQKMQDHMLKMHEQMHKIMDAKDPAQRDKLMAEHREMMKKQMQMMKRHKGDGKHEGSDKPAAGGAEHQH